MSKPHHTARPSDLDSAPRTLDFERRCPECGTMYPSDALRCPDDGSLLTTTDVATDDVSTLAGSTIDGRFYVGRLLGQGAMGRVYRGAQLTTGRPVAIKILRRKLWADEIVRKRFLREAKLISSFNSPNIVRLIDFGEQGELLFTVLEYVEGVALQRLMRGRPMSFEFALEVAEQVCSALAEAHSHGVVHRDIKPDNIFVVRSPDGRPAIKVLDFGIAHVDRPVADVDENLTREGMVFGTPEYMSPEQARGRTIDQKSDLYAVGVLLFEVLTGDLPFRGHSPTETMVMHLQDRAPDIRAECPDVPQSLADLVQELLQKNPANRPADALALRSRVQSIRKELGIATFQALPKGDLEASLESLHVRRLVTAEYRHPTNSEFPALWLDREVTPVPSAPRFDTSSPWFFVATLIFGILLGIAAAVLVVTVGG